MMRAIGAILVPGVTCDIVALRNVTCHAWHQFASSGLKQILRGGMVDAMYKIPTLPLSTDFETKPVLRELAKSHRALAELKGVTEIIPNQSILIDTLSLQEAKDSSAIENIVTTHDEIFKSDSQSKTYASRAAKEVYNYAAALRGGYESVRSTGLLTNNCILEVQARIEENGAGFRRLPGTELKNQDTGQVVYTPPQEAETVQQLMANLEQYINDDTLCDADPLVKMAIIHHQFESIHPFYDGNGRTGRIVNVLYLVKNGLIDTPVLYLSRHVNQHKGDYYRLLQAVRDKENAWEEWILFILKAIRVTAQDTTVLVRNIRDLMLRFKVAIREQLPKIYSQELLNNLFRHPYTKIDFVSAELGVHRNTAGKYLDELSSAGLVDKYRVAKENFYVNTELFRLLQSAGSEG